MNRKSAGDRVGGLLISGAGSGAENMAIDQALLQQVDRTEIPVLRIYSWKNPTLSLGYFQHYDDRKGHPESEAIDCVRRATGGGAIVHHDELTYSIVMPMKSSNTQARLELYRQVHDVFINVLSHWGVRLARHVDIDGRLGDGRAFLCFQRRTDDDLILSGYKVLGSAQRRTRRSVLQHGSLLLNSSRYAPELPGINDLSSQAIDRDECAETFVQTISAVFGLNWQKGLDSQATSRDVVAIIRERFGNPEWLHRR